MNEDIYSIAKNELGNGEQLLWHGNSNPKFINAESMVQFVFGLVFFSFSIFWTYSANSIGGPSVFALFGIPFICMGLYMLTAPIRIYNDYKRSVYGVTDKRCFIIICKNTKTVKSYPFEEINNIEKKEYSDNTGSIYFAEEITESRRNGRYRTNVKKIGFVRIEDLKKVESLINQFK